MGRPQSFVTRRTSAGSTTFPNTNFAIIDFPWAALKGKPANARGLVFAEEEAGYLAGVKTKLGEAADQIKSGQVEIPRS